MSLGRPRREVSEDEKLRPVTMTLNKRHKGTLDTLSAMLGVSSRSAAAAKLLEAAETMIKNGTLTAEQIAVASLPETST